MSNKLVFAYESKRTDGDLIEDVRDFLDVTAEGEWDLVAWRTDAGTVVVVNAPVSCRTMHLEPLLQSALIPLSAALEEMADRDNEWVDPAPSEDTSSLSQAQATSEKWLASMFDDSNVEPEPEPAPPVEEAPKRRSTRKRRGSVPETPTKKVRAAPEPEEVPPSRGGAKNRRAPAPDPEVSDPVDEVEPESQIEPEPAPEEPKRAERKPVPQEARSGADALMAKLGLKGTLKGSEAMGEMFVFNAEDGQERDEEA